MLKMPMILTADWRIVEISGLNEMQAIYVRDKLHSTLTSRHSMLALCEALCSRVSEELLA